jgi:serine/threonine protein kinase
MNPGTPGVDTILAEAVEIADAAERQAFVGKCCAGDAALQQRVERLIANHFQAGSFLERPAAVVGPEATAAREAAAPAEAPGTDIGPYKLLEQIGEGGMGLVFMAEQTRPVRRRVALKVLKPGMDTRQVVARFEAERQALALMDHPNIARVFDGGATSAGRPYFVMELIRGVPVTEYCDQHRLTTRQRLELFVSVCQALQHAHQKGVIHRDLKPSNVLVTLHDTVAVPKVIDFGIAKATTGPLTERTLFTTFAQMIGTPLYMSPEQAEMNGLDVDTRSDVYSLGVLLYELLTGTTPFDSEALKKGGLDEMRRIIREEEPTTPSQRLDTLDAQACSTVSGRRGVDGRQLRQVLRGEPDWIVMKALEKDRNRRYESASAFAADVQRYLNDEPVLAYLPSAWYRFRKFARRHRGPMVAVAAVLVLLLGGMAGTSWGLVQAERALQAEAQRAAGESRAKDEALTAARAEKRAKDEALEREAETQAVLNFVETHVLSAARPRTWAGGQGYDVQLADAVRAALPFVDQAFAGQPLIEARLRRTMGQAFCDLGDYKAAIEQNERAVALYTKHRGPDHPDTLTSMHGLALTYSHAGRAREAFRLNAETFRLRKAVHGPDDPDTLISMVNLASSYTEVGRPEEAIKLHTEALRRLKAPYGPDHPYSPYSLGCMNALAISYLAAGRAAEAITLHEETLRVRKDVLGADDGDTLASMANLAVAYIAARRSREALDLLEEALRLQKAKQGPNHPDTLNSMNSLAESYRLLGRTGEALKLNEETLRLRKAVLGPYHPHTLASMHNVASSYAEVGRTEEALKLREETLRLRQEKIGRDHPDTLMTMSNLAASYSEAGRAPDALKLNEETLRLRTAALGPDHPDTLASMNNLANSYAAAGRAPEALKLREETLLLRKDRLGPDHPDTLAAMNNLASSYIAVGEASKAVAILQETLALRQRRVTAEPHDSVGQAHLALTHGQMGDAEQARLDYAAAVRAYATSVETFEQLDKVGALMDPFFRRKRNLYCQRLAQCRKTEQAVNDLDFALQQPAAEVAVLLDLRVRFLLKEQQPSAAVASAAKMREFAADEPLQLYKAACLYALCAASAREAKNAAAGPEQLCDEAMELLKRAVAKGFKNTAQMKQDRDLDALREREDFKQLVAEQEAGSREK